jgi:hypothetical protein
MRDRNVNTEVLLEISTQIDDYNKAEQLEAQNSVVACPLTVDWRQS